MWYHGFGNRITVELTAAPAPLFAFLLLHLILAAAIFHVDLAVWLRFLLLALNALALRRHLLLWAFPALDQNADCLTLDEQGRLRLHLNQCPEQEEVWGLVNVVWLSTGCAVLRLRKPRSWAVRWLVVSADTGDGGAFRRFRVWLRHGGFQRQGPLWGLGSTRPVARD